MKDPYYGKKMTAEEALKPIRSGQHILIGSGAAEPVRLVSALAARGKELCDIEITHLMTLGPAPYAGAEFEGCLRHNALFIGPNVRSAVESGLADYTPCSLSDVPGLIRSGRLRVDVALIQVTPPENGFCSLGVSVDILKAAVEAADYVVAQVNSRMPWTEGDSRLLVEDIDAFVVSDLPIIELPSPDLTAASLWIGRYVSELIADGSTLHIGIGDIPNAVLLALGGKKDLGIHSEMISDGLLPLIAKGVINGRKKTLHREKIVGSFCLGSRKLYETVDRNETFEFHPIDYVNNPGIIARNDRMVAINSALQVDLTGQVAAESIENRFYSGVGGQIDFTRGAACSKGGKSIIALPSTAQGGRVSRIVPCLQPGTGVVTTRADVDFVVTEYGIASLKGKTIRERAVALIQIAEPAHRDALISEAKRLGYIDQAHIFAHDPSPYLVELEAKARFKRDEAFFRPIKPSDERSLKDLFYSQSQQTTIMRFGIPLKRLSEKQFQELVTIDFQNSMAIAGFVDEGKGRKKMIAVGRFTALPGSKTAEAAVTVHDAYQGQGIGAFLVNYLTWIAKQRGLEAFRAEVMAVHPRMRKVLEACFKNVDELDLGDDGVSLTVSFKDWKGRENPAKEAAVSLRSN